MATKKKKTEAEKENIIPTPEPEIKMQSFKVLKEFPTAQKVYKVGDIFKHNDKRVINFLKTNNII